MPTKTNWRWAACGNKSTAHYKLAPAKGVQKHLRQVTPAEALRLS